MDQSVVKTLLATTSAEHTAEELARIPLNTKRILYDELTAGHLGQGNQIASLKSLLVRDLNARRYLHVQRLFMDSFQPFLASNLAFSYNERTIKFLLTRLDAFAFWGLASEQFLGELAEQATPILKQASEKRLLEEVFASEKAQDIRKNMCQHCSQALREALADPVEAEALLDKYNMLLRVELRQRHRGTPFHPRNQSVLKFILTLLTHNDRLLPQLNRVIHPSPAMKSATTLVERMEDAFISLEDDYETKQDDPILMQIVPITTLHVLGTYKDVANFLEPVRRIWPLKESFKAYMNHIDTYSIAIRATLIDTAGGGRNWVRRVFISPQDLEKLNGWVESLVLCLEAFDRLGLARDDKLAGMLKSTLRMLGEDIKDGFLDVIRDRAVAAAIDRNGASEDHSHIVALLRLVWKIKATLDEFNNGTSRIKGINLYLREDMQKAFIKALQYKEDETSQERLAHISRICELLYAVDGTLSKIVTIGHHGLISMVSELLDRPGKFTDEEIRLIRNVAEKVEEELDQIAYWKDEKLLAFSEKVARESHRLAPSTEAVSVRSAA